MRLVSKHCDNFCTPTDNPYEFKCGKCGKVVPVEIEIVGRTSEETMAMVKEYMDKKARIL